jgi:hypothetical protein
MSPWAILAKFSKAWACLRTNTFVHRSDDATSALANLMASRRCIAVWPARLESQLIRASQSKRPKRLMEVASFTHRKTALLLQAAYCDYQIGGFKNCDRPVEDILIVLRPRPKIFFQYELRFANSLNGQLVISHPFSPIKKLVPRRSNAANQSAGGIIKEKSSLILEMSP